MNQLDDAAGTRQHSKRGTVDLARHPSTTQRHHNSTAWHQPFRLLIGRQPSVVAHNTDLVHR